MELNINGVVVALVDTGSVSKGGNTKKTASATLQDGTKLYINAYVPDGESKKQTKAVEPKIRKNAAPQPDMAALVAEAVAKALAGLQPKVQTVEVKPSK